MRAAVIASVSANGYFALCGAGLLGLAIHWRSLLIAHSQHTLAGIHESVECLDAFCH